MSSDPLGPHDNVARTLRAIALGATAIGFVALLGDVLLLVFAAILLAVILLRTSRFVARHTGLRRGFTLALLLAALVAIGASGIWWRGPDIAAETGDLMAQLRQRGMELREALHGTGWGEMLFNRARDYVTGEGAAGAATGIATSTLGFLGSLVVLIATSIYLAATPGLYLNGAVRLLPPEWRGRGRDVLSAIGDTLAGWFVGQLVDMIVVGAVSYAGLALLGVPLAGTLAMIAALMNFVPYVGAIVGAAPAVLVALGDGIPLATQTAALFVAIQAVEGNLIAPLIQRRTIALPPVLTILSQTVLGTLFGPMGLVLATPLAAAALVAVRMIYIEDVLGDRTGEGP